LAGSHSPSPLPRSGALCGACGPGSGRSRRARHGVHASFVWWARRRVFARRPEGGALSRVFGRRGRAPPDHCPSVVWQTVLGAARGGAATRRAAGAAVGLVVPPTLARPTGGVFDFCCRRPPRCFFPRALCFACTLEKIAVQGLPSQWASRPDADPGVGQATRTTPLGMARRSQCRPHPNSKQNRVAPCEHPNNCTSVEPPCLETERIQKVNLFGAAVGLVRDGSVRWDPFGVAPHNPGLNGRRRTDQVGKHECVT